MSAPVQAGLPLPGGPVEEYRQMAGQQAAQSLSLLQGLRVQLCGWLLAGAIPPEMETAYLAELHRFSELPWRGSGR